MIRGCGLSLAALALLTAQDLSAQHIASVPVTATVIAVPAAPVIARLVIVALREWPTERMQRRDGLVWIDAEAPRGGRRRITINHLAN